MAAALTPMAGNQESFGRLTTVPSASKGTSSENPFNASHSHTTKFTRITLQAKMSNNGIIA
jgi:hypothetical protein